jgi:hypothetical protein
MENEKITPGSRYYSKPVGRLPRFLKLVAFEGFYHPRTFLYLRLPLSFRPTGRLLPFLRSFALSYLTFPS